MCFFIGGIMVKALMGYVIFLISFILTIKLSVFTVALIFSWKEICEQHKIEKDIKDMIKRNKI